MFRSHDIISYILSTRSSWSMTFANVCKLNLDPNQHRQSGPNPPAVSHTSTLSAGSTASGASTPAAIASLAASAALAEPTAPPAAARPATSADTAGSTQTQMTMPAAMSAKEAAAAFHLAPPVMSPTRAGGALLGAKPIAIKGSAIKTSATAPAARSVEFAVEVLYLESPLPVIACHAPGHFNVAVCLGRVCMGVGTSHEDHDLVSKFIMFWLDITLTRWGCLAGARQQIRYRQL